MKCLVAGWFSFEQMGATAGDLLVKDIVCDRLAKAGIPYEVALAPPFACDVQWMHMDPFEFTDIIFTCGPFGNGWPVTEFISHFSAARFSGLNLSMLQPLAEWNPFHFLIERDSDRACHPDFAFATVGKRSPVAGVIFAHKQKEYGERSLHEQAERSIHQMIRRKGAAMVEIDTSLLHNKGGLTTSAQIESLISKMDVVITTRLHGAVLSLKNGVPVIPVDPIKGGAKISAQVKAIGWPLLFIADEINEHALEDAFEFCLSEEARLQAMECSMAARQMVDTLLDEFVGALEKEKELRMADFKR